MPDGLDQQAATTGASNEPSPRIVYRPLRRKLPDEYQAITHKFMVDGTEGRITVGLYENREPGEIIICIDKQGSTLAGLMETLSVSLSYNLQYGVPLKFLTDRLGGMRFEPSGWSGDQRMPYAKSLIDYIFRWLAITFLGEADGDTKEERGCDTELPDASASAVATGQLLPNDYTGF